KILTTILKNNRKTLRLVSIKPIPDENMAQALFQFLLESHTTKFQLLIDDYSERTKRLADVLLRSKNIDLNLENSCLASEELSALINILPQSKIKSLSLKINIENRYFLTNILLLQTKLLKLNLEESMIGDEGVVILAEALLKSAIKELSLKGNRIYSKGAFALAKALPHSQITRLNLKNNIIHNKGAVALAEALPQSQITSLNLKNNNIQSKGAVALARVLPQTQITELNLAYNTIDSEGAGALAEALSQWKIIHLNLDGNHIGSEVAIFLAKQSLQPRTPSKERKVDTLRLSF
ncbi:MAG: hypothetical protein Q8S01_03020, partial [Ignavibacteria bacterium]|nr:hypothetical protein [Ignavibacteria bacterium]